MLAKALQSAAKAVEPAYIEDVFSTYLYTGNGSTQTITNGIDLSGKGGLVWARARAIASDHWLVDTARGRGVGLFSNTTAGNQTSTSTQDVTSFNSDGFSVGTPFNSSVNTSSQSIVSWTFRKQAKFFDCFTYTGTGSSLTLSHSLGSTPGCIILKRTDTASTFGWLVWHRSVGANNLRLNSTEAAGATFANQVSSVTSTQFTIGTTGDINSNGGTYVAYLFAHDAGGFGLSGSDNVISCGSFTMASGDVSVNLGYEPQWVLLKVSSGTTSDWYLVDTMRGFDYTNPNGLRANTSGAEFAFGGNYLRPTATGFVANSGFFGSSATYIYIAIRRGPMKTPTTGTSVYNAITRTGNSPTATNVTGVGFAPDLVIAKCRSPGLDNGGVVDRLRGARVGSYPDTSAAEMTSPASDDLVSFNMDGISVGGLFNFPGFNKSGSTLVNWLFRRAPGFFDEVCYTGTGGPNNVTHNLSVVPEFVIAKARSAAQGWGVFVKVGAAQYSQFGFDTTNAAVDYSALSVVTSTTVNVNNIGDSTGASNSQNGRTYVAYLFATVAGVSKVGTYTGNGTSQTINCGFTGGARFVLIKRTDSTGDWYVWDSARGIVAGNDPHLSLNTTAAEVTTDDSVDTDSTGFVVNQLAATNVNVNSATYIFLAVA